MEDLPFLSITACWSGASADHGLLAYIYVTECSTVSYSDGVQLPVRPRQLATQPQVKCDGASLRLDRRGRVAGKGSGWPNGSSIGSLHTSAQP